MDTSSALKSKLDKAILDQSATVNVERSGESNEGRFRFGPGLLVAAAFIGPGTVVSASKAGAQFGCELLWTILFASAGAIVLQLFAARLGIIAGMGLGEFIRVSLRDSPWLRPAAALIVGALGVGNAAYQTGNLSGAATGLTAIAGGDVRWWIAGLAACTILILSIGQYQILQRALIGLVVLLSLSFLTTAAFSFPSLAAVARGLLVPTVTAESLTLVVALIGTTIVPYNLFLHASSAAENWKSVEVSRALYQARWDTILSIALGGIVTASILLTANTAFFERGEEFSSLAGIAEQLRPVLGRFSGVTFAVGVFSAGLTSAITAPLATAYALCGILGWKAEVRSRHFRWIAFGVVFVGAFFATVFGRSPAQTIVFAQVTNGLLLPVVAVLLLWTATRQSKLSVPKPLAMAGWAVVVLVTSLAVWKIFSVLG